MTTVSGTLKLFDSMTGPLKSITQGMNLMVSTMYKMQSAANRDLNVDKMLIAAKNQIASAEAHINQSIRDSTSQQNKFNQSVQQGKKESEGLLSSLKAMAAAYLSIEGAKRLFEATFGGADELSRQQMAINARTGAQGPKIFQDVINESFGRYGTGDYLAALKGAGSFLANTTNSKQIVQLERLAARLQQLAPEQGFEGAIFSLKELMGGDYTSIAERFNISRNSLQNSAARKAGLANDVPGFIKGMDQLLNQQNITEGSLSKMLDQPGVKWEKTMNRFKYNLANTGQLGLQAFQPLIESINKAFDEGKFKPFFNGLTIGLKVFADLASKAGSFIVNNLDLVRSTLIAIGIVLAALAIEWIVSWVAAAWPVFAAIGAIAALLYILDKLGVSVSDVVGAITGVFYTWFAFMWNQIAYLYNPIISFAEFLVNVFIDPVYAIKKLFYDMVKNVVDYLGSMVSGIIDNINFLIKKLNEVAHTNLGDLGNFDSKWVEALKPTTDKNVVDFSKYKMQMKDLGDAFNKGFTKGSGYVSKFSGMLNGLNGLGSYGATGTPNINKVNEVGKINSTVDISSEDLKTMRELAEMKNIQNFVTLQPKISFGDTHVKQDGRSVDEIIANIGDRLSQEIASSAQGVYGS